LYNGTEEASYVALFCSFLHSTHRGERFGAFSDKIVQIPAQEMIVGHVVHSFLLPTVQQHYM
jgi:hypothetical protein